MNKQEILKQRAEKISLLQEEETKNVIVGIQFLLNDEVYMIEYPCIEEVTPIKQITPLAQVPDVILGLTTIRSQVVTLVDLKVVLDLEKTKPKKAILLNNGTARFAIAADEVIGPGEIEADALQTELSTLSAEKQAFLKGFTAQGICLLDADKILNSPNLRVKHG